MSMALAAARTWVKVKNPKHPAYRGRRIPVLRMILAEKRGLLTSENRADARAAIEEKYPAAPNVIGVVVGR
jgi:hypothetical protein